MLVYPVIQIIKLAICQNMIKVKCIQHSILLDEVLYVLNMENINKLIKQILAGAGIIKTIVYIAILAESGQLIVVYCFRGNKTLCRAICINIVQL